MTQLSPIVTAQSDCKSEIFPKVLNCWTQRTTRHIIFKTAALGQLSQTGSSFGDYSLIKVSAFAKDGWSL